MCNCNATVQHGICRGPGYPLVCEHRGRDTCRWPRSPRRSGVAEGEGAAPWAMCVCVRERVMSSYVMYCRAQAAECVRRAKLASSPELAAERRNLGLRWLRLAQKAKAPPLGGVREPAPPAEQAERR